jgi:hypothetical protein
MSYGCRCCGRRAARCLVSIVPLSCLYRHMCLSLPLTAALPGIWLQVLRLARCELHAAVVLSVQTHVLAAATNGCPSWHTAAVFAACALRAARCRGCCCAVCAVYNTPPCFVPQVLRLARCELHDAGGAVVLSALRSHPCLRELDLSWNALSHGTAKAVEAAFRYGQHVVPHAV